MVKIIEWNEEHKIMCGKISHSFWNVTSLVLYHKNFQQINLLTCQVVWPMTPQQCVKDCYLNLLILLDTNSRDILLYGDIMNFFFYFFFINFL